MQVAVAELTAKLVLPFYPRLLPQKERVEKHLAKVVEWPLGAMKLSCGVASKPAKHTGAARFYALLMRKSPWTTWTNDIYDAMRCIDHLPIS